MPLTHALVSAVSDGGDTSLVRPSDWNADHSGTSEWDVVVVKSTDQDVTNDATLTDDTALQFSVGSGEIWKIWLEIIYAGTSTAGDYKCRGTVSAGTMHGAWLDLEYANTADSSIQGNQSLINSAASSATLNCGTDGTGGVRPIVVIAYLRFSASATFKWQFAQVTATSSTVARTSAGSRLLAKKLV